MTKAKSKPMDPQESARLRAEAKAARDNHADQVDSLADRLSLAQNSNVEPGREERRDRWIPARRSDVFSLLLVRSTEGEGAFTGAMFTAARRLERDVLVRAGLKDSDIKERVDTSGPGRPVVWFQIEAAKRIGEALKIIGDLNGRLLLELIQPTSLLTKGEVDSWRAAVRIITGKRDRRAQSAAVRDACGALADAYQEIDHRPRSG